MILGREKFICSAARDDWPFVDTALSDNVQAYPGNIDRTGLAIGGMSIDGLAVRRNAMSFADACLLRQFDVPLTAPMHSATTFE